MTRSAGFGMYAAFLLLGRLAAAVVAPSLICPSATFAAECRIDEGPCIGAADGVAVILEIAPRPVRTMRALQFSVRVQEGGRLVSDAEVTVDLSMPGMEMGRNRIVLSARPGGRYEGTGTIVRCPSGGKRWKAAVTIVREGRSRTAEYFFEVR